MGIWDELIEWGIRLVMIPIIARQHRVGVAAAWLLFVLFMPWVGAPLYLLLGEYRLRSGVRKHAQIRERIEEQCRKLFESTQVYQQLPENDGKQLSRLAYQLTQRENGCFPLVGGNDIELISDVAQCVNRLVADIDNARQSVHLEFFIFNDDDTGRRVAGALARAAERGVACRLLADAYASRSMVSESMFRTLKPWLERHGVQVHAMLPTNPLRRPFTRFDLRNHRKLAIIDGRIGHVGSLNIHDSDFNLEQGEWFQMMIRCDGPASLQLQMLFVEDWHFEAKELLEGDEIFPPCQPREGIAAQVIPGGPTYHDHLLQHLFIAAVSDSEKQLVITTPYLVMDEAVRTPLELAALRGVDVNIILPYRSDERIADVAGQADYESLLRAGVKLHHHRPGFMHAKSITVDDHVTIIGSANFDNRSLYLNYEATIMVFDEKITQQTRAAQLGLLREAQVLELEPWLHRPRRKRMVQNVARLAGPLL